MKKLLYIFILLPLIVKAQTVSDWDPSLYDWYEDAQSYTYPIITDNNMSAIFLSGSLSDFAGGQLMAFKDGVPVSAPSTIYESESSGVAVIGRDYYCIYCDHLPVSGDLIEFAILFNGETIVNVGVNPPITYAANGFVWLAEYILDFTVEGVPIEFGCTDYNYLEYSPSANIYDGSCEVLRIDGCTDSEACNYDSGSNADDGSCYYEAQYYNCDGNCLIDSDGDGVCDELEIPGCQDPIYLEYNPSATNEDSSCNTLVVYGCTYYFALNFNSLANVNDGSCLVEGCTEDWADNYDVLATENDGSCYKVGCTEDWADNYDTIATTDDGSCDRLGCVSDWADNYDALATTDDGSCYRIGCVSDWADNFDEYATDDDESCYRYGCTSNLAVNYDQYATIDNDNCDFDIITHLNMSFDAWNVSVDLSSGWNMFGYGCPSPIDVIEGLSNHTESIEITKDNNGAVYMPEWGFNGIGDFTPGFGYQIKVTEAIEGFSLCDWYVNDIPEDNIVSLQEYIIQIGDSIEFLNVYHIGDLAKGGIVFYVDESGQHGLVAAMEDLEGTYEWGCDQQEVNGADGTSIGKGYQNTMDIVNQGCATESVGITAAQAALDAEINGYSDWYLPSRDELYLMYLNIGQGGLNANNNIGGFTSIYNWSSSETNYNTAWLVNLYDGTMSFDYSKAYPTRVRIIRAF